MAESLASRFGKLFRGLQRAHGIYNIPSGAQGTAEYKAGKIEGRARTVEEPVTAQLWEKHLAGKQGLGIIPVTDDSISYFGAIDIDVYPIDTDQVEALVATAGLPLLPTRTKSGGVHLYLFIPKGAPTPLVRSKLSLWAKLLGYPAAEVFPKQDRIDVGNWINMPYFNATDTQRYGIHHGQALSAEKYLTLAGRIGVTAEFLDREVELEGEAGTAEAIAAAHTPVVLTGNAGEDFEQSPPCLQVLARNHGFVSGVRNKGLFAIGVYLRKRYPEGWEDKFRAYNLKYVNPSLDGKELNDTLRSVSRKKYNYNCKDEPLKGVCNRPVCIKRDFGIDRGAEDRWGVTFDEGPLKVNTQPPYWIIGVNGVSVKLFSEDLQAQQRFNKICMEHVNYCPPLLPAMKWNEILNSLLSTAKVVEAPADASAVGELAYHLEQFCTVCPQAEAREELLVGKPWTDDKVTYFRAGDFKRYLESQRFRGNGGGAHLYSELRELGVQHGQLWVAEQNIRIWSVKQYEHKAVEVPPRKVKQEEGSM